MPTQLALMFDFDGTLYVGDLPILAYARHCAELLPPDGATDLIDGIRFFLEGKAFGDRTFDLRAAEDGFQAVEILAAAAGLTETQVDAAYRSARGDLIASAFALEPPEGLTELLTELVDVHVMVVTNADPAGVDEVLASIGLAGHVAEIITDAGKPESMAGIIDGVLRRIDAAGEPDHLMVVGDRWGADLAAAAELGAVTGMIDRFGRKDGTPTVRAHDLAGLVPDIRRWAATHGALTEGAAR